MNVKLFGCFVAVGAVMVWSSASAQNSRAVNSKHEQLISSIQGRQLYKPYCATCHGADARGNGPMAKSLKVTPADLTHISARNGGTFPLMRIERVVLGEEQL